MSQELLYTSAPRGLKPGSRGFSTVLSTQGMAAPLATALEGLSGYRPIYPAGDDHANRNPVVYSHLKLQAAGRISNVLSRIADFGLDYSQRANKLAHHVVLDKTELLPGGPASLLSMRDFMREEWAGEPKVVALKPVKREGRLASGPCRAWEELTGDAGWAGVLAESFLRDPERLVLLLFAPGQDILPLFVEALALLPAERRWDVTFSTYFTGLAPGTTCVWRALVHDSKEAHESLRFVNALRLDLTSGSLGRATGDALVEAARTGVRPHDAKPRTAPPIGPVEEEFVELEAAQVEFASDEQQAADIRFAGIPQRPPQLAPGRNSLPTTAASQPRSGRRLADVIEAESRRPRSRRWLWLTLTAVVLIITTWFGVAKYSSKQNATVETPSDPAVQSEMEVPKPTENQGAELSLKKLEQEQLDSADLIVDQMKEKQIEKTDPMAPDPALPVAPNPAPADPADTVASKPLAKLLHEVVEVPTSGKPQVKLHSINASAVQNPPKILLLLKPSWLPYTDAEPTSVHKKDYAAQRAITFPTATESISIALFTVIQDKEVGWFKLKSLHDDHTRWLGWYRVRVLSPNAQEPPLKEISFTSFPLDETKLKRNFGKEATIAWKLPNTAAVDGSHLPKLILDRLIVRISGTRRSLDVTPLDEPSTWKASLAEFTTDSYSKLGVDSHGSSPLVVTLGVNTDKAAIELKLSGRNKFLKALEDALAKSLFDLKLNLTKLCELDSDLNQAVETQFKGLSVTSNPGGGGTLNVAATIGEQVVKLRAESKKKKDEERGKVLDAVDDRVAELEALFIRIVEFRSVAKSLDNVEVASAHIYYVLKDTKKNSELSVEVDVVNFGGTAKDDAEQKPEAEKGAKQ